MFLPHFNINVMCNSPYNASKNSPESGEFWFRRCRWMISIKILIVSDITVTAYCGVNIGASIVDLLLRIKYNYEMHNWNKLITSLKLPDIEGTINRLEGVTLESHILMNVPFRIVTYFKSTLLPPRWLDYYWVHLGFRTKIWNCKWICLNYHIHIKKSCKRQFCFQWLSLVQDHLSARAIICTVHWIVIVGILHCAFPSNLIIHDYENDFSVWSY